MWEAHKDGTVTADAHPVLPAQVRPRLLEAHLPRSWEADRSVWRTDVHHECGPFKTAGLVGTELAAAGTSQMAHLWCVCREWKPPGAKQRGLGGLLGTRWCELSVRHPEELRQPACRAPGLAHAALMAIPTPRPGSPSSVSPRVLAGSLAVSSTWTRPGDNPGQYSSPGRSEPVIHPNCASTICTSS